MSEYYAVVRSGDHLAHYGVKGMKWGVRKAIAKGNEKALDRHFRKAAKKLAKLQDIGMNPKKYAAKSAAYGVAAAGTGTIAVGGTGLYSSMLRGSAKKLMRKAHLMEASARAHHNHTGPIAANSKLTDDTAQRLAAQADKKVAKAVNVDAWGKSGKGKGQRIVYDEKGNYKLVNTEYGLDNNAKIRLGAGIVTAGLAAKSVQNAYRAKNAGKYRQKAYDFKNAMDDVFSGTKYSGQYVAPPKKKKRRRSGSNA